MWFITDAQPSDSGAAPSTPRSPGVTPGLVNDTNNLSVQAEAIEAGLSSIPRYFLDQGPDWLSISEFEGKLSGTPPEDAVGTFDVTIRRANSFTPFNQVFESTQTFVLSVAPGPPLDPDADDDGDGIINLFEVAFAGDPDVAESPADIFPSVVISDGKVGISYRQPVGGTFNPVTGVYTFTDFRGDSYVYEIECSTDLENWTLFADQPGVLEFESQNVDPSEPDVSVLTIREVDAIQAGEPQKFLRVKVTRTAAF